MKHDLFARYGQYVMAGAIFTLALAIWTRILRGPAIWLDVISIVAILIFTTYYLVLATNWRNATKRYVEYEQRASRARGQSTSPKNRIRQVRRTSGLGLGGGIIMLVGTILQALGHITR